MAVGGADAVWFDGVPDDDGARRFADVSAGQEISVFVDSAGGRGRYALYVLPQGFPTLSGTVSGTVAPGLVALTLNRFDGGSAPRFEAIVDRQGVPTYTRRVTDGTSTDLKQSPAGTLTVHRPTSAAGRTGTALVELGDQMQEVARHETRGRVDTDNHDGLLMPDGSVWLLGYEPNAAPGRTDSVIQHVAADGTVLFDWSTAAYANETTVANPANPDYAHINSIDVQPNGDVVASFRHFGSVWRIAGADRAGYEKYDVVWKLGGRDSSFSFAPGEDGPCSQHTATVLPNGNVLMFDNGGNLLFGARCVDQDDPSGPLLDRSSTRVVEWDIDEVAGTATVAKQYGATDRFSGFAGGAFKLANGNVLIAWAPSRRACRTGRACAGPGAQRGRYDGPVPAPGAGLGRPGLGRRQLRVRGARTHPSSERARLAHSPAGAGRAPAAGGPGEDRCFGGPAAQRRSRHCRVGGRPGQGAPGDPAPPASVTWTARRCAPRRARRHPSHIVEDGPTIRDFVLWKGRPLPETS